MIITGFSTAAGVASSAQKRDGGRADDNEFVDPNVNVVGSATSGLISQVGPPGKVGDLLFGVVNAYEPAMKRKRDRQREREDTRRGCNRTA